MFAHDRAELAHDRAELAHDRAELSRRSLLHGAVGAGAVGIAAVSGGGAVMAARPAAPAAAETVPAARMADAGPLVVYLRDAATGEMEVFAGAGQARFRDPALAARLLSRAQTDVR